MKDYWFFLSYARRDAKDNPYLRLFYEALASRVAKSAAINAAVETKDIGFFDVSDIETGDVWDETLQEALQTSKVFVCLYSRSYFSSDYCGKEFTVFRDRLEAYSRTNNVRRPPLIMPVLWDRPSKLPKNLPQIVSEIQYTHDEFGPEYADQGLDLLMRQKENADAYEKFIVDFGDKLEEVGRLNPPLTQHQRVQTLAAVQSAFHAAIAPPAQGDLAPQTESELENVGPDFVHLVFIAGRKDELNGVKKELEAYGDRGGRYWRPYVQELDKMVGLITQSVAASENLQQEVLPVRGDLVEKLRKLEDTNTIVVIVVDPWSIKVKSYQAYMRDYDKGNFVNCGVLILWNQKDNELTEETHERLREVIEATFSGNVVIGNPCFRDSILSADEMAKELKTIIEKVRGRLMQRAKLLRPMETASNSSIPRVSGPGGR